MELKISKNRNRKSDEKIETNRTSVLFLTLSNSPKVLKFAAEIDKKWSTT
jgi:hypothetical protein